MHGIIHAELRNFIVNRHGQDLWQAILIEAGLGQKMYISLTAYPDEDAVAIIKAAAGKLNRTTDQVYEDFGLFIAPKLLAMYKTLIKPQWKTLDMLLNTEETIHRIVRLKNPGAQPPRLRFDKVDRNTLKFHYDSPRRMAAVAKGIIKGVAAYYLETVTIKEKKAANGACEMEIKISNPTNR